MYVDRGRAGPAVSSSSATTATATTTTASALRGGGERVGPSTGQGGGGHSSLPSHVTSTPITYADDAVEVDMDEDDRGGAGGGHANASTLSQRGVGGSAAATSHAWPPPGRSGNNVSRTSRTPPMSHLSTTTSPAATTGPPSHFDDANLYTGPESNTAENFKVVIRVRPPVPRELHSYRPYVDVVQVSPETPRLITLIDALDTEDGRGVVYSRQSFTFDYVYTASAGQEEVYDRSARPAVLSVIEGYNATLIAYGQTGTGKTYTMEGFTSEEERGVIPRAIEDIFACIYQQRDDSRDVRYLVRASYMQIYNEVISDLLQPPPVNATNRSLTVRHTPQRGVYVEGLSEWIVRSPDDVYGLIEKGTALRATSTTRMSELSSRSHALFTVVVEVMEGDMDHPTAYHFGKLNIVDLAGSEKVRQTGVTGQRLEETKKINRSLHELGNVISALAARSTGKPRHIPFRNSVLTSALRDSLGGNCKTTLIACISPALESYTESLSTLMFANRAKNIRNSAVINEDVDQATLLRKYEKELQRLKQLLSERSTTGYVDPSVLSELEEDRRRAEDEREAALEALQQSSIAYEHEQQTRQQLESRIHELEGIISEGGMAGSPRTSEEYTLRLEELDRERQAMEEDKVQVERYKQLLLKQRDIMLSLTTRLNERDETILQLQEEIDAYDAHVQLLEQQLASVAAEWQLPPPDHPSPPPALTTDNANSRAESAQGRTVPSPSSSSSSPGGGGTAVRRAGSPGPSSSCLVSHKPLSQAQAADYVRQCKVIAAASPSSPSGGGGGGPRYRSDLKPSTLLDADAKLEEVLMLRGGSGTPLVSLSDDELGVLQEALKKRAGEIARVQYAERLARLSTQNASLCMKLATSEAKRRVLEAGVTVPDTTPAEAQRLLREEGDRLQRTFDAQVAELTERVTTERAERRRLARDVDRLRFEVERLLEDVRYTPSQRAEASRLWQTLLNVEEEVLHTSTGDSVAEAFAGSGDATDAAQTLRQSTVELDRVWQLKLQERDAIIENLRSRLGTAPTPQTSSSPSPEANAALREELERHKKDRRALHTILQQRIKAKVDAICGVMDVSTMEAHTRLVTEARSLQNLVNAAITAMESGQ